MILGTFGTLVGLMLSPYCPRCKPMDTCFIDAACVHQADETLMKRGIHGIGGFLLVSKELRIIWSPVYFTRLWCAALLKIQEFVFLDSMYIYIYIYIYIHIYIEIYIIDNDS